MPVRIVVTEGTRADCSQAKQLIEGLQAEPLIADKGYDSDVIVEPAQAQGMHAQIPSRQNRNAPRKYDEHLHGHRHLVENACLHIKP